MKNKVIQAHGANDGAICAKCQQDGDHLELKKAIKQGKILRCKLDFFEEEDTEEKDKDGKLLTKKVNRGLCDGPIKPKITFFGESLPKEIYKAWEKIKDVIDDDLNAIRLEPDPNPKKRYEDGGCDLMFVIGTALAVTPFNQTVF